MKNVFFKALSAVVMACVALSLLFTAGPAAETAHAATGTGSIEIDGLRRQTLTMSGMIITIRQGLA